MQSICILGRQPSLGMAELESLYGAAVLRPAGRGAVLVDLPAKDIAFARLGGSIKLCKLLTILDTTNWGDIEKFLVTQTPSHATMLPKGKLTIGLSVYGLQIAAKRLLATGLSVKKAIKQTGRPVRLVPNPELALNSAQVLHNQLISERAWELVFVRDGNKTIVAQTTNVQDIEAYTLRDRGRPKRDARVGMLPPKLAQTIVNLATGLTRDEKLTVLDPFCGTGVVLQEATLMNYSVYGTDLDQRMINYTNENLSWLEKQTHQSVQGTTEIGDATSHVWQEQPFSTIACETYLGRPFSAPPKPDMLQHVMQDVNLIHKKFLQNVARQTKSGFRMCIAVPAWFAGSSIKHLKVLEILPELGYTRMEFAHAGHDQLIYHRENQIVGRELVVLVRK